MAIEGSVQASLTATGDQTITLPSSDLTIVGLSCSAGVLTLPIDTSRTAVFLGGDNVPVPYFTEVAFTPKSNQLKFTVSVVPCIVTFYYGKPLPGSKTLEDYAGVYTTSVVTITTTTPNGVVNGPQVTLALPSGKYKAKGIIAFNSSGDVGGGSFPSVGVSFQTSVGKQLAIDFGTQQTQFKHGAAPLNVELPDTLTMSTYVFQYAEETSDANVTIYIVLYYGA